MFPGEKIGSFYLGFCFLCCRSAIVYRLALIQSKLPCPKKFLVIRLVKVGFKLFYKETSAQAFFLWICEIFKNTFSMEHLRWLLLDFISFASSPPLKNYFKYEVFISVLQVRLCLFLITGLSLITYTKNWSFWFPLSVNTQPYILVHTLSPSP